MKLAEVEERLQHLDLSAGQDLIFELLAAYGTPQASITKLRSGTYNKSADDDTVLWKKKVWDTYTTGDDDSLLSFLGRAQADTDIRALKPRFYVARNDSRIAAVDSRLGDTLDILLADLPRHAAFFMPWAGAEKVRSETATYVDTKVAAQMAKLYDEILVANPGLTANDDNRRQLNVFFSRLLFCFFAEDTGVFPDGVFTNALNNLTANDGSDTAEFFDQLFDVLDTAPDKRTSLPSHLDPFGYVNGSLFGERISSPVFSRKARNIVVDCGTLDWSSINPDIFGSMIQAVVSTDDRANLGMHYTSVENILKVLNPLFLDELEERFEEVSDSGSVNKLEKLLDHLGEVKIFDPACGSGNFLIVAYKRLRSLEHRTLQRIGELHSGKARLFADSRIALEHFYGIEIDDFAHDIAKLSLWLAKHQMNVEYDELFGIERPLIPLTESGNIQCANATRVDWKEVCPPSAETFICGNPPYVGSVQQTTGQKADMKSYFGGDGFPKDLDYISLWFHKAADYMQGTRITAGLVATNSICQGQHVDLLWSALLKKDVSIEFAHTSFRWNNQARLAAGVDCIVVGFVVGPPSNPRLFDGSRQVRARNISPYLVDSPDNTIVKAAAAALADRPKMVLGNKPADGGSLVLTPNEAAKIRQEHPCGKSFLLSYLGAQELLHSKQRFALWIEEEDLAEAMSIPAIRSRVEAVGTFRASSRSKATRNFNQDHRFIFAPHQKSISILIPGHSSARRELIPVALMTSSGIASNALYVVYQAEPWLFGLIHSRLHNSWIRVVCGRIKSDYRYSHTLGYNTFPFPELDDQRKMGLSERTFEILAARERWPDRSLAELYDPDRMPANLRAAHEANDAYVDGLYRSKPFASDAERMEVLLAMYRDLVAEQDGANTRKSKRG